MPRKYAPKRPPKRSAKSKAPPRDGAGAKEAQYARFLEAAREAEVSDDPKAFDKALKRVTSPKSC
jgi:hypothetical protein